MRLKYWLALSRSSCRFTVCITSPPYLNSFDYTDVYRPELFLGRWANDTDDLRRIRRRTLRSHVQYSWREPKQREFGPAYTSVMTDLLERKGRLWDRRLPLMVQAYFEDLSRVLGNLRRCANSNAYVWLVVSTSAYAGVEIPVDLILGHIASSAGWLLQEIAVIRYLDRLAGQQWSELSGRDAGPRLRESLVVLRADA